MTSRTGQRYTVGAMRQLSTRQVYVNPWMVVREDRIRRPDGSDGIFGVIDKPDYALIVPADADRLHLVEQFRYRSGCAAGSSRRAPRRTGPMPTRSSWPAASCARKPGCAPPG